MNHQATVMPPVEGMADARAGRRKQRRARRRRNNAQHLFDDFSHDFRTPLTVINEYLSLLREDLDGSQNDQQQLLDVVADRLDDLNRTFDNMSDAMKLESGTLDVCRRTCEVAEIVARVRPILERKAAMMCGQLQVDVPSQLPAVYCDHEQIGRVVVNLATHAIKCCGSLGTVQVWAKRGERQDAIVVGVTAVGNACEPMTITPEPQQDVPHAARSFESMRNFGPKLRIARDLVRLNLGELDVESSAEATTLRFELPVVDPAGIVARYLKQTFERPSSPSTVSFITVRGSSASNGKLQRDVNNFLGMLLRPKDLMLQVDETQWLIALCRKRPGLPLFLRQLEEMRDAVNRKRCREPLPAIRVELLETCRSPKGIESILETINRSFTAGTGNTRERTG